MANCHLNLQDNGVKLSINITSYEDYKYWLKSFDTGSTEKDKMTENYPEFQCPLPHRKTMLVCTVDLLTRGEVWNCKIWAHALSDGNPLVHTFPFLFHVRLT